MADPFATALAALHRAAGSVAAIYTPAGGQPLADPIRVIRYQGSEEVGQFARRATVDPNHFSIQRIDIAAPARGDMLTIGAETFRINGGPKLDDEGLSWICPAEPA